MPKPKEKKSLVDLKNNLTDKYVAFIDVMGFKNLVDRKRIDDLETYFSRITEILEEIKRDKATIASLMISDSIILIAPDTLEDFTKLLTAIRRIQSALLNKKILMRGAVSFGQVFYDQTKNIIVGKGYIRAFQLESEAKYPRVILDPLIIKKLGADKADFLEQINGNDSYTFEDRMIYEHREFTRLPDDAIFIDYANKIIRKHNVTSTMRSVHEMIIDNLYQEQSLYSKYIWLRDYFYECLKWTYIQIEEDESVLKRHKTNIEQWKDKFDRL